MTFKLGFSKLYYGKQAISHSRNYDKCGTSKEWWDRLGRYHALIRTSLPIVSGVGNCHCFHSLLLKLSVYMTIFFIYIFLFLH